MIDYCFLRFPAFREKAVTLSYDDGTEHDVKLVEILNRYGVKCTFNLNSGMFGLAGEDRRLTEDEVVALYKDSPHEVAVYGVKHYSLSQIPHETAVDDIVSDRKNLEKLFSRIVKGMAYANGSVNDEVIDILRYCGIKYARTTFSTGSFDIPTDWLRLGATCHHNDPKLSVLTERFLQDYDSNSSFWWKPAKLFYLWGHSYEFNRDNNWDVIENFAKAVGEREDVWCATNCEVYDYVQAYNRLECSVDAKRIYNPSAIDVYTQWYGTKIIIPAGDVVTI